MTGDANKEMWEASPERFAGTTAKNGTKKKENAG